MKIKQINHGIACRIADTIYINKRIFKNYPELYYALLEHESKHSLGYVKQDIFMDLSIKELKGLKKDYYHFILHNPSSWTEFLPAFFYENTFVWNPSMVFVYCMGVISFFIMRWILG